MFSDGSPKILFSQLSITLPHFTVPHSYKVLNFEATCTVTSMQHSLDLYSEILPTCTESRWEVTSKLIHCSFPKESVPILRYQLSHIFPCKSISLVLLITSAPQATYTQNPIHTIYLYFHSLVTALVLRLVSPVMFVSLSTSVGFGRLKAVCPTYWSIVAIAPIKGI